MIRTEIMRFYRNAKTYLRSDALDLAESFAVLIASLCRLLLGVCALLVGWAWVPARAVGLLASDTWYSASVVKRIWAGGMNARQLRALHAIAVSRAQRFPRAQVYIRLAAATKAALKARHYTDRPAG